MSDYPGICWDFTFICQQCKQEIQVVGGQEQDHGCPPSPVPVVSGCDPWVEFDQFEEFADRHRHITEEETA